MATKSIVAAAITFCIAACERDGGPREHARDTTVECLLSFQASSNVALIVRSFCPGPSVLLMGRNEHCQIGGAVGRPGLPVV